MSRPQRVGDVIARVEDNGHLTHWRIVRIGRDPLGAVIEYEPAIPLPRRP